MWPPVHDKPGHVQFFSAFIGEEERIYKEVFYLAYHLHWGHAEILDLPADERQGYLRLLAAQLESEQEALMQSRQR
jgi:hypothetical protein